MKYFKMFFALMVVGIMIFSFSSAIAGVTTHTYLNCQDPVLYSDYCFGTAEEHANAVHYMSGYGCTIPMCVWHEDPNVPTD